MIKSKRPVFGIITPLLLVTFVMTITSGCEPLRKKFTRQKKKDAGTAEFIPVLDPVDYPDKVATAEELYRHYYSLWQVWDRELLVSVQQQTSDKRIKANLDQVLVQLTEMGKLLTGEKQKTLQGYTDQVNTIQKDLIQPAQMRNNGLIQRKLERLDKSVREGFRFKEVQGSLTQ